MAQRWKGVLRLPAERKGSGSSGSEGGHFRVMASLACGPSGALVTPASNALFFVGDRVLGSVNPVVQRLSKLEHIAAAVQPKLGHAANLWVVEPSHFAGAFACYESMLPGLTASGEPAGGYDPRGLPAARACVALLRACLGQVRATGVGLQEAKSEPGEKEKEKEKDSPFRPFFGPEMGPRTVLLGFSKGGVVLNQLLAEMVHCAESRDADVQPGEMRRGDGGGALVPGSVEAFLGSVEAVHYVDVGLNCRGAYQTDPGVLEGLAKAAGARGGGGGGLSVAVHGTPRQWQDLNRRWIAAEKNLCLELLTEAARKHGGGKLRVAERLYFASRPPDLQMHFEIIDSLVLD